MAEGYRQKVIADSEGKAARFLSIQEEYAKAPAVTKKRIFYETMEDVFSDMDKVIIDKESGIKFNPDVVIVLAWNFFESIKEENEKHT